MKILKMPCIELGLLVSFCGMLLGGSCTKAL